MAAAVQVINAYNQDLGGTGFVALTAGSGDSFTTQTVPGAGDAPVGYLAEIWAVNSAHVCEYSIYGSRWHDQTYGFRVASPAGSSFAPSGTPLCLSPAGIDQPIYSADTLTIRASGQDNDKVNMSFLVYYPELPGIAFNGVTSAYVRQNLRYIVGVNVQPTSGSGNWGSSVVLNSQTDLLHAGRQYAVLGFTAQNAIQCVGVQGIDTGNFRVGGPVTGDPKTDQGMFLRLADAYNAPLVPVIQANNAGAINVYAANLTGATEVIDIVLAELTTTPISA